MGNLLFFILRFFKSIRVFFRKLRGKTEEPIHDERIVSGKAWDDFCENLKTAGAALMYPGTPKDPFQQAEGIRYLTRLTRAGLEAFVEFNDPAFPFFRRMVHETVKMGADNPDNHYYNAQISGEYEYLIKGKRNTIHYLGFFTQNGNYGTTGGMAPCGSLEHTAMEIEPDGTFEIVLSKKPRGKNWLKIEENTGLVIVRQTFLDRSMEVPAEISIKNLDGRKVPDPVTPEGMDKGLQTAALFVAGAPLLFVRWAKNFRQNTNQLPMFDPEVSNAAGGDGNIIYYHSYWKLAEDEALVITVKPPRCDSWNFQLNNYWMESLDYRYFPVTINKATAIYNPEGAVRIIVSSFNPGLPNWIQTCGHTEGTMCWRWYRLEPGAVPVEPECTVVKKAELIIS
jgi:hypothetical protein